MNKLSDDDLLEAIKLLRSLSTARLKFLQRVVAEQPQALKIPFEVELDGRERLKAHKAARQVHLEEAIAASAASPGMAST